MNLEQSAQQERERRRERCQRRYDLLLAAGLTPDQARRARQWSDRRIERELDVKMAEETEAETEDKTP